MFLSLQHMDFHIHVYKKARLFSIKFKTAYKPLIMLFIHVCTYPYAHSLKGFFRTFCYNQVFMHSCISIWYWKLVHSKTLMLVSYITRLYLSIHAFIKYWVFLIISVLCSCMKKSYNSELVFSGKRSISIYQTISQGWEHWLKWAMGQM